MKPSIPELSLGLEQAWSAATATTWSPDNPARGQCSVTALVVQDLIGGTIFKTRVGERWHFYNRVDGERVDLTAAQFAVPLAYEDVPSGREDAFADTSIEQYEALRRALARRLE